MKDQVLRPSGATALPPEDAGARPIESAIVETRYRDIPWQDFAEDLTEYGRASMQQVWETSVRGSPILVRTPAVDTVDHDTLRCAGPMYLRREFGGDAAAQHPRQPPRRGLLAYRGDRRLRMDSKWTPPRPAPEDGIESQSSSIVWARFRDIAFAEYARCIYPESLERYRDWHWHDWEMIRGTPVQLHMPAVTHLRGPCGGPFYRIAAGGITGGERFACIHCVEFGGER